MTGIAKEGSGVPRRDAAGRILIVDDERAFRVGMSTLLWDEGFEVEGLSDPALVRVFVRSFDRIVEARVRPDREWPLEPAPAGSRALPLCAGLDPVSFQTITEIA